jgi:hypothetical protein
MTALSFPLVATVALAVTEILFDVGDHSGRV